jgi:alkaline phosphatase D
MALSYPLTRRRFLATVGSAGTGFLVNPVLAGPDGVRAAAYSGAGTVLPANLFTLGIASGDPAPDGVVLWTRLAPDPLHGGGMPARSVPVRVGSGG